MNYMSDHSIIRIEERTEDYKIVRIFDLGTTIRVSILLFIRTESTIT